MGKILLLERDLSFLGNWISIVIVKLTHKRIIWHIHDDLISNKVFFPGCKKATKYIFEFCIRTPDLIAVLSPKNKNIAGNFINPERIEVLPPCVKIFGGVKNENRNSNLFRVLYIGWLVKDKGIYDLLDIAKIIKQKGIKDIRFDVLGTGMSEKETTEIYKEIETHSLNDIVILHGLVMGQEKEEFLSNSDLFFSPTYWDAFPLVILEAMAFGLPILSTNVGGIVEIINNHGGAILTAPGDIEHMLKAIINLTYDKKLCKNMGLSNKKIYEDSYSPKVIIDKASKYYKKILVNTS